MVKPSLLYPMRVRKARGHQSRKAALKGGLLFCPTDGDLCTSLLESSPREVCEIESNHLLRSEGAVMRRGLSTEGGYRQTP